MEKTKNWTNLISLLCVFMSIYGIFYFIFFFILGSNSVELIIAFSFIFLIFIIYKKTASYLYNYLWSLSKGIWLHYASLLMLLKSMKEMTINLNRLYLNFIEYKVIVLNSVSFSLDNIWHNLNIILINKYFVNNILKQLFYKINFIEKNNNYIQKLPVIYCNVTFNINMNSIYSLIILLNNLKK
jgi:hypothetical protein